MEHPQPSVLLADPKTGFVRRDHRAALQISLEPIGLFGEGSTGGPEDIDQGPLADLKPEQVFEQSAQPGQRDALHRAQIDDIGARFWPERRARFKTSRRLSLEGLGAARTHTPPCSTTGVTSGSIVGISMWS